MQISKYNNNTHLDKIINFTRLINELELSNGYKVNKRRLNYRLLNNESIKLNDNEYFRKI